MKPEAHDSDELIRAEALRVAKSIQKPGQTKEQTKLIAQGIAKGIEQYKKQQSAKARERDKSRKRALRLKQTETAAEQVEQYDDSIDMVSTAVWPLRVGAAVFAVMALAHLLRAILGWTVVLGPWTVPVGLSWAVAVPLVGLAGWLLRAAQGE